VSRRNGDKTRFGSQRNEQIHRREKIREFRKALMKAGDSRRTNQGLVKNDTFE
jgi:hypothetical protein